ncbi:DUF2642 domain-containing protein [Bacillus sp. FSL K6-3431]|uniref:DUF2642 domain-containing protein n=1 Tax=Bacillus sp. FSL K6-3431 TaxID=2921500 RepID=UPI0030FC55D3
MEKENLVDVLSILIGFKVGIFLNNDQFVEGLLLDVKQDHLIVEVDHNVFYFALQQIYALSKNAKDFRASSNIVPHLDRNHLTDILSALRYSWVTINSLNNQTLVGLLSRISEDHIILINNDEKLYIQKSYISNICKGIYEIEDRQGDTSQEKAVQDSLSDTNDESKEQLDSSENEEARDTHQVNQDVEKNIQITNENELEKDDQVPSKLSNDSEETDVESFNNGDRNVISKIEFIGESIFQQSEKHNVLKRDEEFSHDEGCQDVLESNQYSAMNEEQYIFIEPQYNKRENRKHRTRVNPKCNDQQAFTSQNHSVEDLGLPANVIKSLKKEGYSELSKTTASPRCNHSKNFKLTRRNVEGKSEAANVKATHNPIKKMSPQEEKVMLENQYYALMKHAEKMYHQLKQERFGK